MKSRLWLSLSVVLFIWGTLCVANPQPAAATATNDKVAFDQELDSILGTGDDELLTLNKNTKLDLADDPMFNKMLPDARPTIAVPEIKIPVVKTKTTASSKVTTEAVPSSPKKDSTFLEDVAHSEVKKDETEDDYSDYEYYYDEDEDKNVDEVDKALNKVLEGHKSEKLKPIRGDDSIAPPSTTIIIPTTSTPTATPSQKSAKVTTSNNKLTSDDDDDADEMSEDEYDSLYDDKIEEDVILPCPRDCICRRNQNDFMVATCSRLDDGVQNFGSDITDLEVVNVGPKYPIFLGENFFKRIGLKNVISIKIINCTIENIAPTAFNGLRDLYSVNLTNTGLDMIHPDTFANNTKLKLLSLAGNDLSAMQVEQSPYTSYMLNAPSVEELDLSRCKLRELLPTAFEKLSNIVFINLSHNGIVTLPATLFHKVETIEELDLSFNSIEKLPRTIFNKTSLSMLHLKHNEISNTLDFLTSDLQKLDLSYCKIRVINGQLFKTLEGLQSLQLKGNKISKINQAAFMPMRHLRHIDLSHNDLKQVPALLFLKNKDLDVIKLNDNPRLKALPSEGFESETDTFSVYHLDVSYCDIEELGDNVFASMPHLSRLNLAWNNLQKISKAVFKPLKKLKDLDLSDNILQQLDEHIFDNNNALTKLNLAGNVFKSIHPNVFAFTISLSELDLSNCILTKIWSTQPTPSTLNRLRFLNVSNNDLLTIQLNDINFMSELSVLDLSENPLVCDPDFMDVMTFVGKHKVMAGNANTEQGTHAALKKLPANAKTAQHSWQSLTYKVCSDYRESIAKSTTTSKPSNSKEPLELNDEYYEDYDLNKEKDDEEADLAESSKEQVKDGGLTVKVFDTIQKVQDEIIGGKAKKKTQNDILDPLSKSPIEEIDDLDEDDDDNDDEDSDEEEYTDEELIKMFDIEETEPPFLARYANLWVIMIIMFSLIAILLIAARCVSHLMHKRHERYRQAILASKNSIVYQKLSEDIGKMPAIPKIHGYQPVNQV